jgi:hypothetical protein
LIDRFATPPTHSRMRWTRRFIFILLSIATLLLFVGLPYAFSSSSRQQGAANVLIARTLASTTDSTPTPEPSPTPTPSPAPTPSPSPSPTPTPESCSGKWTLTLTRTSDNSSYDVFTSGSQNETYSNVCRLDDFCQQTYSLPNVHTIINSSEQVVAKHICCNE